jgi:hypothetical protein
VRAHRVGMPLVVEENETADPSDVDSLGARAVVPDPDGVADTVEKSGRFGCGAVVRRQRHAPKASNGLASPAGTAWPDDRPCQIPETGCGT